jgi:hypothetical protein
MKKIFTTISPLWMLVLLFSIMSYSGMAQSKKATLIKNHYKSKIESVGIKRETRNINTNRSAAVPVNDLICGALPLTVGGAFLGDDTGLANSSDADDAAATSAGYIVSTPNNTLWYSFAATTTGTIQVVFTVPVTNGLDGWLGLFEAATCTDPLTFIDYYATPTPSGLGDTARFNISVVAGTNYYFMVDGYSGAIGEFTMGIEAPASGVPCGGSLLNTYLFNEPLTNNGGYNGFLCDVIDSVGTTGGSNYFDGDGYAINLYSGSQVTFRIDSCSTTVPVSLTVCDSNAVPIPGAYAVSACPNSINFTATYDGTFIIVMNANGICGGAGSTGIGQVFCVNQPGALLPACPPPPTYPVNDTICGAIDLVLNAAMVAGNSTDAAALDPRDAEVDAVNLCSVPNNTLWYTFTPAVTDSFDIMYDTPVGSGFSAWLLLFDAPSCTDPLNYDDCFAGPDDLAAVNSTVTRMQLVGGTTYYLIVDGVNGSTGEFSLGVNSVTSGLNEFANNIRSLSVYPNPANNLLSIDYSFANTTEMNVQLIDVTGRAVYSNNVIASKKGVNNVNVKDLSNGVYILKLSNGSGNISRKVLIQH